MSDLALMRPFTMISKHVRVQIHIKTARVRREITDATAASKREHARRTVAAIAAEQIALQHHSRAVAADRVRRLLCALCMRRVQCANVGGVAKTAHNVEHIEQVCKCVCVYVCRQKTLTGCADLRDGTHKTTHAQNNVNV